MRRSAALKPCGKERRGEENAGERGGGWAKGEFVGEVSLGR